MTTASTHLTITVWEDPDSAPRTWELTADPPGGTHPDPGAAVTAIETARNPFAPVPKDAICTQIWGGPQRAVIEGVWRGQPVSATYDKRNGCEIARWNALRAVLDAGTGT
ncbi:SSI family serine proteinase inhibitor [Actinopolymorpha alba]|uniref:SSI family serine proteinase inhibitor n=1 Tax=Actinopolymorpha alba TaxID=533267 RepID=UPI00035FAC5C|nr:SSI family serine proteinase inhibitor [Actinopolymorpha alba]